MVIPWGKHACECMCFALYMFPDSKGCSSMCSSQASETSDSGSVDETLAKMEKQDKRHETVVESRSCLHNVTYMSHQQ